MTKHVVLAVVLLSSAAHAQRAPAPTDLRLSLRCADHLSLPENGLRIIVDGTPLDATRLDTTTSWAVDDEGGTIATTTPPRDVVYAIAPGAHHIDVEEPDCVPAAFDLDTRTGDDQVDGRLALANPRLRGPVGAPDGTSLELGAALHAPLVAGEGMLAGGYVGFTWERRWFTTGADLSLSAGSAPAGHAIDLRPEVRVGARVPLYWASLAAGTGVGGDLEGEPGGAFRAGFYLPMWASVTVKPACSWGVHVIGQYDLHPASIESGGFGLVAGIEWQPSSSCSEAPGLHVRQG